MQLKFRKQSNPLLVFHFNIHKMRRLERFLNFGILNLKCFVT